MANIGYAYVPTSCQTNDDCDIHVAFHGCVQNLSKIGMKFVELTQYQEVAESNNMIIMFPQAETSTFMPSNPNGCWDWWGYSESSSFLNPAYKYATKQGFQMNQVMGHVKALREGKLVLTPALHHQFESE